ncbi:hypothetical protein BN938_1810 [Mucinivorans hirudinis]|uniref:Uncharacterized protein n=1 Tax=Mucinivorans hirudinis TaxID=1433126 RepID=A0A060R8P5_9BACT|nr:hypothetical protein BN938_1810 [Mucinivorans hirudinis]
MEHNQEYYDKEFTCTESSITRGELESLPCPFCTDGVSDETMQNIINLTDNATKQIVRERNLEGININDETYYEIWWAELESAVIHFKIPYYEDLPETE